MFLDEVVKRCQKYQFPKTRARFRLVNLLGSLDAFFSPNPFLLSSIGKDQRFRAKEILKA